MLEPELPKLLDAEQVGEVLGKDPRVVLAMARDGRLPAIKLGHRTVRFDPSDVRDYIARHRALVNGKAAP